MRNDSERVRDIHEIYSTVDLSLLFFFLVAFIARLRIRDNFRFIVTFRALYLI